MFISWKDARQNLSVPYIYKKQKKTCCCSCSWSVFHVEGKLKCTRATQIVCNYPIYACMNTLLCSVLYICARNMLCNVLCPAFFFYLFLVSTYVYQLTKMLNTGSWGRLINAIIFHGCKHLLCVFVFIWNVPRAYQRREEKKINNMRCQQAWAWSLFKLDSKLINFHGADWIRI